MMQRRIGNPASRGFSLSEVLVAVALLSVILLAMFGLVTSGVRRAYGGKKMTEATILAQSVMERANIVAPQDLLSAAGTDTTATRVWTKPGPAVGSVTPAAEAGGTVPMDERNAWRALLDNSGLPTAATKPATLTVTLTALPAGRTFATAAAVRIVVNVGWAEYGTRDRVVQVQTLNIRSPFV